MHIYFCILNYILYFNSPRGYRAMCAHEERVSRSGRSRTDTFAWYQSQTVCPPDECNTDDEFEDSDETRPFRGKYVECRKYSEHDAATFLSKLPQLIFKISKTLNFSYVACS